jgi:hypothetical protein
MPSPLSYDNVNFCLLNVVTTTFKKTLFGDNIGISRIDTRKKRRRLVTSFKKTSLSDNICNVVHRAIDVDCACWHDLTVTSSLFHARFPRARGQQNTATTGHLSVLKPLNPLTPKRYGRVWGSRTESSIVKMNPHAALHIAVQ